jgi:protein SCO1/2
LRARAFLAALALGLAACSNEEAPTIRALKEPRALRPFALVDHRGQPFDQKRLAGRWTFVTFGYTSCADACPTMLVNLADLRRSLLADWTGAEPQFVFVSVDPARDTLDLLAKYVPAFDPEFLGVTGPRESLDRLHDDFGGAHRVRQATAAHSHYMVDHSSLLYLVAPDGRLTAQFAPPFDPPVLARHVSSITKAGTR